MNVNTVTYKYPGAVLIIVVFDILDIETLIVRENTDSNKQ